MHNEEVFASVIQHRLRALHTHRVGAAGGTFLSEAAVRRDPGGPPPVRAGAPLAARADSAPVVARSGAYRYRAPARRARPVADTEDTHNPHRRSNRLPHAGGLGRRAPKRARRAHWRNGVENGGFRSRRSREGPKLRCVGVVVGQLRRCEDAPHRLLVGPSPVEHAAPGRLREVVRSCVGVHRDLARFLPER